jgi:hypothetical protein
MRKTVGMIITIATNAPFRENASQNGAGSLMSC